MRSLIFFTPRYTRPFSSRFTVTRKCSGISNYRPITSSRRYINTKQITMGPTIKLSSGHEMPQVGFGLWKVDNATCADTVYNAIKAGYRLFDGACGKSDPSIPSIHSLLLPLSRTWRENMKNMQVEESPSSDSITPPPSIFRGDPCLPRSACRAIGGHVSIYPEMDLNKTLSILLGR